MNLFARGDRKIDISIRVERSRPDKRSRHSTKKDSPRIVIATDLMLSAWRQLFPAERMIVFGGHKTELGVRVTSLVDVTDARASAAHVRACPDRMAQALLDFERTGTQLALWMHSHPGDGPRSTHPSDIDLRQEKDLRQHYPNIISVIAVRDGWLRFWGQPIDRKLMQLQWRGTGVEPDSSNVHLYRLGI